MKNLNLTLFRKRIVLFLIVTMAAFALVSCLSKDTTEPDVSDLEEASPYAFRPDWSYASSPLTEGIQKGSINYFNSQDFYYKDVYEDSLMDESQYYEKIQVLRCKLTENEESDSTGVGNYWAGVTRHLEEPVNLYNIDYIELQILENDDVFDEVPITMHINLGWISEDFFEEEKGILNTEDQNGDDLLDYGEDIGLDGVDDWDWEDTEWDDFDADKITIMGYEEYPNINRSEGNNRLDTEDLNNNGMLDRANAYYEYSVDLDSDEFLYEVNGKGLRTYHIPCTSFEIITDPNNYPDTYCLKFVRFWFEYPEPTYAILISAKFESYEERSESVDLLKLD